MNIQTPEGLSPEVIALHRMVRPIPKWQMSWDVMRKIRRNPHLLGHIAGYTKLTKLHSKWIRYCWDTDEHRALQGHRGSYKSTSIVVLGAIYWMLFHPNDRIAIIRKTATAAQEAIDTIARIMEMPEIRHIFAFAHGHAPRAESKRQGHLRYNFKHTVTPEGNINGFGLDGSLTGKHFDKIICDDIVTLRDRVSRAERVKTLEMIREILTNIIDPGKPVSIIGTPWHRDDMWQHIPFDALKFPVSATGILSEEEIAAKRLTTTPFLFNINYNLSVEGSEGRLFQSPQYGKWNHQLNGAVAHLDAAFDGNHFCALTIVKPLADGTYCALGFSYAGNVKDWLDFIAEKCKRYRVTTLWNETNPDKGFTADALRAKGVRLSTYAESSNKHTKISTHLYDVWKKLIWDYETDDEYMNQVIDYSEGQEPDDAPDSASSLFKNAFPSSKAGAARSLYAW